LHFSTSGIFDIKSKVTLQPDHLSYLSGRLSQNHLGQDHLSQDNYLYFIFNYFDFNYLDLLKS